MCYYIQENKMILLLKTSNKCKNDQCPTFQEYKDNNPNYKKEIKHAKKKRKNGMITS
jgi:hypothetical protein